MGCNCKDRAASGATYPRKVTMPDGSVVEVTSAPDERAQRLQIQQRMREQSRGRGYSVTSR